MSLHSRPLPAPKTPAEVASKSIRTHVPRPEPLPEPQQVGSTSNEISPAEPIRARESRVEPEATDATSKPWYRSEPWLLATIASIPPLVAAAFAPDTMKYPLIGLSVIALLVGAVMLIRQGVHRPHPDAGPHRN